MTCPRAQTESPGLACRARERERERESERERERARESEREREREPRSEKGCSIRPAACGLAVMFLPDLVAEKLKE